MSRLLLFAAAAGLLSCSSATGPVATVEVTVTSVAVTNSGALDAVVVAEVTNNTAHDIRLGPCGGVSLERQNGSEAWDSVWSLPCLLVSSSYHVMIAAGTSMPLTTRIIGGSGTAFPSVTRDGKYRLSFSVFPPDELIERISVVTNLIAATPVVSNEFVFADQ